MEKLIIYQMFPRIMTNMNPACVHAGTYAVNGAGKLNQISTRLLASLRDMGINAVWYTGIIEHATKTDFSTFGIEPDNPHVVKGEAGSPYAIKDYYDVSPELAEDVPNRMAEFEALVARTHRAGLKCFIDFVPNHTARRYHSDAAPEGTEDFGVSDDTTLFFSPSNNYYYITSQQFSPSVPLGSGRNAYVEFPAKATGNDCFNAFCSEYDWYETVKLNYGVDYGNGSRHFDPTPDTWVKMHDILHFWAEKGVDGFRCDMVFMVPLEFWHWVIPRLKRDFPHLIFIGEIYDVGLYRPYLDYGCFDYLYDKVNLYDKLVGIQTSGVSAAQLTYAWQTVDGIGPRMLNFLENHDEVRFGSDAYASDPSLVIPSLVVSAMISTGPMMIYYGQELGERATENEGFAGMNHRTTIFDYWSLSTLRRWYDGGLCHEEKLTQQEVWLRSVYSRVLNLCNSEKAISGGTFFDLMYVNLNNPTVNPHRQFIFLRHHGHVTLLIAANFADTEAVIDVNIPSEAFRMMELPTGAGRCRELLHGQTATMTLKRNVFDSSENSDSSDNTMAALSLTVAPHNAVVWRIDSRLFH